MGRKQRGKKVSTGLGKALVNKKKKRAQNRTKPQRYAGLHVTDMEADGGAGMLQSVTERSDLDEFLCNALLAQERFESQGSNVIVLDAATAAAMRTEEIAGQSVNPLMLGQEGLADTEVFEMSDLPVPRRPAWDRTTTPEQLDQMERESFLDWRRSLAATEESTPEATITPFEKNLEVWRQLWRVIERSDLIAQIVDARDPLLYHCADLSRYVREVDPAKVPVLIVNKADFLSEHMRVCWAKYFAENNIEFVFFSAAAEQAKLDEFAVEVEDSKSALYPTRLPEDPRALEEPSDDEVDKTQTPTHLHKTVRRRDILNREQLLSYLMWRFNKAGTKPLREDGRVTLGMVGYPNVGKSSTINVLCGGVKRVSVGATPGKTKHFQTLLLGNDVCVCDCPGLVFPSFTSSRAELVVSGVLPIHQLRDHTGPMQVLVSRISAEQLRQRYGLKFLAEAVATGKPIQYQELLDTHAHMRGFLKDHGRPDDSRSARLILSDYVRGRLVYCHPPPTLELAERQQFFFSLNPELAHTFEEDRVEEDEFTEEQLRSLPQSELQAIVDSRPAPAPDVTAPDDILDGVVPGSRPKPEPVVKMKKLNRRQKRRARKLKKAMRKNGNFARTVEGPAMHMTPNRPEDKLE